MKVIDCGAVAPDTSDNHIHHTAVIDPSCVMGAGNVIGPYTVIGPKVTIGDNNAIGPHACIGMPGQWRGRESAGGVVIGNGNIIREFAKVHAAMEGNTTIGDDCYIMSGATIDHDCALENGVTMCSGAALGGTVRISKGATIGAGAMLHQGQTVGAYAMVGMGATVPKDVNVEPGEKYAGNPARHLGRNTLGLRRAGIRDLTDEQIRHAMTRARPTVSPFRLACNELQNYMKSRSRDYQQKRYDILRDVVAELPYLRTDDAANVYNMAFSLAWQQHEDFKADQVLIREILIDCLAGGRLPKKEAGKGKIGWLINHVALGTYAPYKHVHAYLSGMEPCEVIVYGSVREQEARALMEMGHNLHHVKGGCEGVTDAVKSICEETGVGCLISEVYLAVPLWSIIKGAAPMTAYLSPGFQLFPAHTVLLPETQERICDEARMPQERVETIPTAVLKEHLFEPVARKPKGKVFGVLSRAEKCSKEYLRMVQRVLNAVPDSEFHFYGRGDLDVYDARFKARGIQNAHEALSQIDVYLDSWPTCSGLSAFEAMAHGVPVVTLDHPSVASWNQFKPCVVQTDGEYVETAQQALGRKGEEIAAAGREIVEARITNIPRAVESLYQGLTRQGWSA